jgi:hypothetical protein
MTTTHAAIDQLRQDMQRRRRATLFSAQDTPLLKALDKFREAAYDDGGGRQQIVGAFTPGNTDGVS